MQDEIIPTGIRKQKQKNIDELLPNNYVDSIHR